MSTHMRGGLKIMSKVIRQEAALALYGALREFPLPSKFKSVQSYIMALDAWHKAHALPALNKAEGR